MRVVTIISGIAAAISGVALAESARLLPPALTTVFVASAIVAIWTGMRWERRERNV